MKLIINDIPLKVYDHEHRVTWTLMSPTDVPVDHGTKINDGVIEIDYEPLFVGPNDAPARATDGYWLIYTIVSPAGVPKLNRELKCLTEYEQ